MVAVKASSIAAIQYNRPGVTDHQSRLATKNKAAHTPQMTRYQRSHHTENAVLFMPGSMIRQSPKKGKSKKIISKMLCSRI